MKLYFSPGACSMAPHIVLLEARFDFESDKVDLATRRTAGGEDYTKVSPKGYVPALRLDNGHFLTEVAVILQYLADQKPEPGLAPRAGSMERYRLMEWLNFISSEIHKTLGPLFWPNITTEAREAQLNLLGRRLDYLEHALEGKPFLMGDKFTVADAYLFTVLNWRHRLKFELGKWPEITDYMNRIATRPAVQEAMRAEGLIE